MQAYDHNRKRLQAEKFSISKTPESETKEKIKFKVSLQENQQGFKKSVKKLTVGLNSPRKKEILLEYFKKCGIKVECESKSECKTDNTISILQLKAFKLQN